MANDTAPSWPVRYWRQLPTTFSRASVEWSFSVKKTVCASRGSTGSADSETAPASSTAPRAATRHRSKRNVMTALQQIGGRVETRTDHHGQPLIRSQAIPGSMVSKEEFSHRLNTN